MRKTRLIAAGAAIAALAGSAVPAQAALTDTQTQLVQGVPVDSLALSVPATPMILTGFKPGSTATGSSALTVTSTLPSWTLQVADLTSNAGALGRAGNAIDLVTGLPLSGVTCDTANSELKTGNSMKIASISGLANATAAPGVAGQSISGTPLTLATGTLVGALNMNVNLPIGSSEQLSNTCLYNTTLTYTVQ